MITPQITMAIAVIGAVLNLAGLILVLALMLTQ